jgi:hypothetical protein
MHQSAVQTAGKECLVRLCSIFLAALLVISSLFAPALAALPVTGPLATGSNAEVAAPAHVTPVTGVNNSKTPTEIQISTPGQASYRTIISPAVPARKKTAHAANAPLPACATMKAPYRSGLWEITSVSNNSLMPQPITAKIKRCVTERDTQNACGLNQLAGGRNRDCQLVDMQVMSNTATWSMRCNSPSFMAQGSGQSTFTADAYQGKFDMNATLQGARMQMNTTFTGKRLGNCK